MVQTGFTGVPNVLDGEHNALEAHSREPRPEEMVNGLGSKFFVTETSIKTFAVGFPVQAALDAFFTLRREHALTIGNVDRIVVRLPALIESVNRLEELKSVRELVPLLSG